MDIKVKTDFGRKILIEKSRTCQDAYMVKHSWTSSYAKKLYLKKFDIGKLLIFCRRGLNWTFYSIPFFCMRRFSIIFSEKFLWKPLKVFCAKSCQGKLCANSSKFFPPKVLIKTRNFFPVRLLIDLINNYLSY